MKKLTPTIKKASYVMIALACLYSSATFAQRGGGNRQSGNDSRHDGGGCRQMTTRDQSPRQTPAARPDFGSRDNSNRQISRPQQNDNRIFGDNRIFNRPDN